MCDEIFLIFHPRGLHTLFASSFAFWIIHSEEIWLHFVFHFQFLLKKTWDMRTLWPKDKGYMDFFFGFSFHLPDYNVSFIQTISFIICTQDSHKERFHHRLTKRKNTKRGKGNGSAELVCLFVCVCMNVLWFYTFSFFTYRQEKNRNRIRSTNQIESEKRKEKSSWKEILFIKEKII